MLLKHMQGVDTSRLQWEVHVLPPARSDASPRLFLSVARSMLHAFSVPLLNPIIIMISPAVIHAKVLCPKSNREQVPLPSFIVVRLDSTRNPRVWP